MFGRLKDRRRVAPAMTGVRRFSFPPVDLARGNAAIAMMREIASANTCTVAQVALAWLLHQPVVTSVIVGARRIDQLQDNIRSTGWR